MINIYSKENQNWFKNLFLSTLVSISLSLAIIKFSVTLLKIDKIYITQWNDIFKYFLNVPFLYWLILVYFIFNLIRYYLSSFYFEAISQYNLRTPSYIFQQMKENLSSLYRYFYEEYLKNSKNRDKKITFTFIIDIFFSCLTIIILSLSAYSIDHFVSFATIFIILIFIDIIQILYQRIFYIPQAGKLVNDISKILLPILLENKDKISNAEDKNKIDEFVKELKSLNNNSANKTLYIWLFIDIFELIIWIALIYSYIINNLTQVYILFISLFIFYFLDVYLNSKEWLKIVGIKISEM